MRDLKGLNTEFVIVGECVGRPGGWRRWWLDSVCAVTGHLVWRVMNTEYLPPDHSLPHYGVHCLRCYRYGYMQGDYRNHIQARRLGEVKLTDWKESE
jgi:hypothetical protein